MVHAQKACTNSEFVPCNPGPARVSAGQSLFSSWRRMRDSNPRGREPNSLSKSALGPAVRFRTHREAEITCICN
jgi:hypothetical protein